MTWRARLAFLAGLLAAAGVTLGVLFATGVIGGGDTEAAAEAVLRLEPAEQTVSCGDTATLQLFLDELTFRPSTQDENVPFGIGLVQVPLRYDPNVVRLGDASAVELNPDLSAADPDGDGIVRSFIRIFDADDGRGEALLAAVSNVANVQTGQDEPGPAPAEGTPLLLMTVRFLAAAEGTTEVALRDPDAQASLGLAQVTDPVQGPYEPVGVEEAKLTVEGGTCPDLPPLPTATEEPAATAVQPTRTPRRPTTPSPITPTPAQSLRPDCPADWAAYKDPDGYFSVCYPAEWRATSSPPQAYFGTIFSLQKPGSLSLTMYWSESGPIDRGTEADLCVPVGQWKDLEEVTLTLAGRTVTACRGEELLHAPEAGRVLGTFAEIPLGERKGYLVMFLTEAESSGSAVRETVSSIVDSLKADKADE